MATKNILVPDARLSRVDQREYILNALAAGLERCTKKGVGSVDADVPGLASISVDQVGARVKLIRQYIATGNWPKSVEVAQIDPTTELTVATALDDWLTAALAAVGTYYSCFQAIAAPQMLANKLLVCYGVSIGATPIPVSKLRFRKGGAAANIVAEVDLQDLETKDEPSGFFGEPVVFDPQDVFAIQARASIATGAAARVYIRNFIFGTPTRTV